MSAGVGAGRVAARVGGWIDRVRINALRVETREGVEWVVKRRLAAARVLVPAANLFFRICGTPIRVLAEGSGWVEREVGSFLLLNGPRFGAFRSGREVWAARLPGESLCRLLARGALRREMLELAGAELRRAHGLAGPGGAEGWTHGDPHLGNFVYDEGEGVVRLIDFEVRSVAAGEAARRAEDLLAPLLDLAGRCAREDWGVWAEALLGGYGEGWVLRELGARLRVPAGTGAWWWAIRTSYVPRREVEWRMEVLREMLGG